MSSGHLPGSSSSGAKGPISNALHGTWLASDRAVSLMFTELGLVMAMSQIDLPLLVLPSFAVLSRVPTDLREAARIAGAGPWRIFATVILPLMLPGLLAGWILVFASTSASFVTQAVIGGARNVYVPQLIYREVGTCSTGRSPPPSPSSCCSRPARPHRPDRPVAHRRLVGHA